MIKHEHHWRKISERIINYPFGIVQVTYLCSCGVVHVQREKRATKSLKT